MGIYKTPLTILQWGKEATKGTAVAATSRVAYETISWKPTDSLYRPKLVKDLKVANRGNEIVIQRGLEWAVEGPVVCNQFQSWLDMTVKGGVTATGAADPYTWTYTRSATILPGLSSRTFEIHLTDGGTSSDWKAAYCMATKLEITGAENGPVAFRVEGFGRRPASGTITSGQAYPAIDLLPTPLTTVYIDNTWAAIGTTPVAGQVLSWKWTLETGAMPLYTLDNRADLDFAGDDLNPDDVKLSAEILILASATATQWLTEKNAAEAASLRAVKIATAASANRSLELKGLFKYTAGSVFPDGNKDNLWTVNLKLEGSTDDVNFVEVVLKNGVNSVS